MAFVVIAIHTHPFENCKNQNFLNGYRILISLAVPFFFLASGYLLAVKMEYPCVREKDLIRLKEKILKIIKMYLIWTIIYLPLAIYYYILHGTSFINSVLLYVRGFVLVGEQYNSWPLWYLLSSIYALIIIRVALKLKKNFSILIWISVIASIISIGLSELANYEGDLLYVISLFRMIIIVTFGDGRLFSGLIYIPIGMILAHNRIPNSVNCVGFVLGFALNYFIDNSIISSYLLIIIAIFLFEIIEKVELKDKLLYLKLRNMSTVIYLIHMYVWTFYYKIVYGGKTYGVDSFLITAIISTVASLIYIIIRKKFRSLLLCYTRRE